MDGTTQFRYNGRMDTNSKPAFRVKRENIGSGQILISSNENGFFQTRARLYDEEAAELLLEALRKKANPISADIPQQTQPPVNGAADTVAKVVCRLPLSKLDGVKKVPNKAPRKKDKARAKG